MLLYELVYFVWYFDILFLMNDVFFDELDIEMDDKIEVEVDLFVKNSLVLLKQVIVCKKKFVCIVEIEKVSEEVGVYVFIVVGCW